jgi:chromate reductase
MTAQRRVAVLVGSLRRESFNRKLANALIGMAPASLRLEVVEIGELPFFNQDLEAAPTPPISAFKRQIEAADAVLFVTPEYNRSVPALLKNAVDVGSRPRGKNSWGGKPGAVISVSPGKYGGFGANHHLRQSLMAVNVPTMPQPEAYIANAASLFDEGGALVDESARALLARYLDSFAAWIERHVSK